MKFPNLLNQKKLRDYIGKNASEFTKLNHSWEIIKKKYIDIYESKV